MQNRCMVDPSKQGVYSGHAASAYVIYAMQERTEDGGAHSLPLQLLPTNLDYGEGVAGSRGS
jgi:hypothetical protein